MKIGVILCTYNRCDKLATALESVAASDLPASVSWEVLVIDNNSTDRTRETVENIARRHPGRFRYIFEARQGKSHALNAGIRESDADVLAFMDDDVTVEASWLRRLTAPLESESWAGAGGRVIAVWHTQRPDWLPESGDILAPLGFLDLGDKAGRMLQAPFGTNMAFRKRVFEKYGNFRTDLGPWPGNEIGGEDTEFGNRVLGGGEQLYYEPAAIVYHPVPSERLSKENLLRWWFDKGRSLVLESSIGLPNKIAVAGVPLVVFKRFAAWTVRWTLAIEPRRRFNCKRNVWVLAGEIVQRYRLHVAL